MGRSRIDRKDYRRELRDAMGHYLPRGGLPLMPVGKQRWSDRMLVVVAILMAWSSLSTLKDRFAEVRDATVAMYRSRRRPGETYAGFIAKLHGHSGRLLKVVVEELRRRLIQSAGEHWTVAGFLAFAADGTKSDAPRTQPNRQKLKIGGKRKSGPQQLLVCLVHVGTGLLWSWRRGQATASERALLLSQLGELPARVLLLMDAGFTGYECLTTILGAGHQVLVRAGANVTLLRKLGWLVEEKAGLVYLWPDKAQRAGLEPLVLREIVIVDGRNRRMCLLTSVLEPWELSDRQAAELYKRRWGIELLYRGLKQTLSRRKMLSDSPENAPVELDWTLVGYWMLGLMLWEHRPASTPVTCGLADALRLVRAAMGRRLDQRTGFIGQWKKLTVDGYHRNRPKASPDWPHKKHDHPCGVPESRTATALEIHRAKQLIAFRHAA